MRLYISIFLIFVVLKHKGVMAVSKVVPYGQNIAYCKGVKLTFKDFKITLTKSETKSFDVEGQQRFRTKEYFEIELNNGKKMKRVYEYGYPGSLPEGFGVPISRTSFFRVSIFNNKLQVDSTNQIWEPGFMRTLAQYDKEFDQIPAYEPQKIIRVVYVYPDFDLVLISRKQELNNVYEKYEASFEKELITFEVRPWDPQLNKVSFKIAGQQFELTSFYNINFNPANPNRSQLLIKVSKKTH